jgi:hypothetical protein
MNNDKLKKQARQGAVISAVGFLAIVIGFVIAGTKLSELNASILEKTNEYQLLDSLNVAISHEIDTHQEMIAQLIEEINRLKDPTVQVRANATAIPGLKDPQNRQVFDFNLWITSSQFTLNRIRKVNYNFSESSFMLKNRASSDDSNGFTVGYRGWGCLTAVAVDVEYTDGEIERIFFNMCEALEN